MHVGVGAFVCFVTCGYEQRAAVLHFVFVSAGWYSLTNLLSADPPWVCLFFELHESRCRSTPSQQSHFCTP